MTQQFAFSSGPVSEQLQNVVLANFATTVVPARAWFTGLMPLGWGVISDHPEPAFDPTSLDFFSPLMDGESGIDSDTLIQLASRAGTMGSLGFGQLFCEAYNAGMKVIPNHLPGNIYIPLTRTILLHPDGSRDMANIGWRGGRAVIGLNSIDDGQRLRQSCRLVRLRH